MIQKSLLVLLLALVCARAFSTKDVYAPTVLYPHEGTVWKVGENRSVIWDTTHPPAEITNWLGSVALRKGDRTLPAMLASNFSILLGKIHVQVPIVTPGDNYRIVLFGDSGNWSPAFTITSD